MVEPTKANAPASMAIFNVLAFHWHLKGLSHGILKITVKLKET